MTKAIKGIKTAVGDFNCWQGAARIYFDSQTGEVWTNVYAGPGEWNEYLDPSVVQIASKSTWSITSRDDRITMRTLRNLCEAAIK